MSKNSIIIIIVVIVIGFLGYRFYTGTATDSSSLSVVEQTKQSAEGKKVLNILNQLNKLELNSEILKDPMYVNLKDTTESIPVQDIGRPNPFSPFGQVNSSVNNPSPSTGRPITSSQSNTKTTTTKKPAVNQPAPAPVDQSIVDEVSGADLETVFE